MRFTRGELSLKEKPSTMAELSMKKQKILKMENKKNTKSPTCIKEKHQTCYSKYCICECHSIFTK